MSAFDKETVEALNSMGGNFLKGSDFENEGVTLKFIKQEKVKGKFGASEDSKLVEIGALEEGESFRFTFEDATGKTRVFDTHSAPFCVAMNRAEVNEGDTLTITRTGKSTETRYSVTVV